MHFARLLFVLVSLCFLTSCIDITGRSAAQLTPMQPAQQSHFHREGHVYCILGWLGIWSRGMDVIAQRVNTELGIEATSLGNPEWRKLATYVRKEHEAGRWSGPLVLVGHSIGSDDQIRVAKLLNASNIPVDLLLLIDANGPGTIPPNVRHCVNIFKSRPVIDYLPVFRGVKVYASDPGRTQIDNIDLRKARVGFDTSPISHFNIAKSKGVQDMVLAEIAKACPPKKR